MRLGLKKQTPALRNGKPPQTEMPPLTPSWNEWWFGSRADKADLTTLFLTCYPPFYDVNFLLAFNVGDIFGCAANRKRLMGAAIA
jgi:hypothetical protein